MPIEVTKFKEITLPRRRYYRYEFLYVESVSWSPDGKYLVTADDDCSIRIWRIKSGNKVKILPSDAYNGCAHKVKWSPKGDLIAFGTKILGIWNWRKNTIITYDLSKEKLIEPTLWSPNGQYLILSIHTNNGIVNKIYDVDKGHFISTLVGYGHIDTWLPKNNYIIGRWNNLIRFWNPFSGGLIKQIKMSYIGKIQCSAVSPDGKFLAAGTSREIIVSNIASGEILWRFNTVRNPKLKHIVDFSARKLSWSPDAHLLAVGTGYLDASVRIFDAESGKLLYDSGYCYSDDVPEEEMDYYIDDEGAGVLDLVWSPNGEFLAKLTPLNPTVYIYMIRKKRKRKTKMKKVSQ